MHRPRYATGFLLAPIVFIMFFLTAGCSAGGTEKTTIDKFFRAARLRDNVTMGNISMAQYDPRTEGQVENTSLVSMTEEQVTPLHLKELQAAVDEAKKADDDFTKRKYAFQDQHTEELNRLLAAQKKGQVLKGKDTGFQQEWQKWVEETKVSAKKLSDAREALSAERSVADTSVANAQNPVDPTQYEGDLATKDYTISAEVITPAGQHVTRRLVITLQQARLKGDKPIIGKWIITKIKDVTAGGTTSS
jgi:hypothetical protein